MSNEGIGVRLPPFGREFVAIVLGVLVALGVDNWNTKRQESVRGQDYVERISHDLRSEAVSLEALLESSEASVASGMALLTVLEGGSSERSSMTLVSGLLLSNFELPVADFTYREVQGSAELRLIRPDAVRTAIVTYYARAEGYHDRLVENRSDLRNPLFNEMAATSVFLAPRFGRVDSVASREVTEQLSLSPIGPELVRQAITYQSTRYFLWRRWLEEVRRTLDAVAKETAGAS